MTNRFLCGILLALSAGLCHGQTPISCAQQTTVRSPQVSATPTVLEFVNASTEAAGIWWIAPDGAAELLQTLPAGQSASFDARQSYVFMIRDAQGRCVRLYSSLSPSAVVRLTAADLPSASSSAPPRQPDVTQPAERTLPAQSGGAALDRVVFSFGYHVAAIDDDPLDAGQHGGKIGALLTRFDPSANYLAAHTAWFSASRAGQIDGARQSAQALRSAFVADVFLKEQRHIFFADMGMWTFAMERRLLEEERLLTTLANARAERRPPEQRALHERALAELERQLSAHRTLAGEQASVAADLAKFCRENGSDLQCPATVAASFERIASLLATPNVQPAEVLRHARAVLAAMLVD